MSGKKNLKKRNKKKKSQTQTKTNNTKKNSKSYKNVSQTRPLFGVPFLFRILIVCMFGLTLYGIKYLFESDMKPKSKDGYYNGINFNEIEFINTNELDLNEKQDNISKRIEKYESDKLPLKTWTIYDYIEENIALEINDILYSLFTHNESIRHDNFLFATNKGNEKLRSNDNIDKKIKYAKQKMLAGKFSYAKYELKRQHKLYQLIHNSLNSTYIADIMTKIIGETILGITDLFVSVYYKDNFLRYALYDIV